ncbi:Ankyrin-2 [Geodia barretti]|uniref:Ankyrin-2 n=1 Tax=Geodia barretti TaxID=519541 RepID=A0AA35TGF3_GEOBA|nr:Ankyrin-2 [Geodia barretti]
MVKYLIEEKNVDSSCQDGNGVTPLHVAAQHAPLEVVKYLIEERHCDDSVRSTLGSLPIHSAALGGRLDTVKYLINERGCDPMCRGQNGWTPLHCACQGGRLDMVKYLIEEKNVDSSCQDGNGGTPLHVAAQYAPLEVVKYLIEERRCDDSVRNTLGSLPIHFAALGGRLDTVKYLINERGCDPMCRGENGLTPLHCACQGGRLDMVKYLIEEKNVDSSCQDGNGFTPLHVAAQYAPLEVVKYLIEERHCDDSVRSTLGSLPIHSAALGGRLDTVKYLINERGCDPMCRGENGLTPLHWACQSGRLDMVKYLIEEKNVDSSCQNGNGITPLHVAAQHAPLEVVKYLIEERHCDDSVRSTLGSLPIHSAALGGRLDTVKYLINERGCDPMCRGENGLTPLHYACQGGRLDIVKYLIEEKNIDSSCQAKDGILPLHIAASNGHLPVVKLLVEDYHCNPGVKDKNGMTPGHWAQRKDHVEISSYLSSMEKAIPSKLAVKTSPSFIPEDASLLRESEDASHEQVEEDTSLLRESEDTSHEQVEEDTSLLKEAEDASHEEVEESFSIYLEEAMKKGYVVVKLVKVIVVGPAGVGKTCLIYLLLAKDPPEERHSTGCAERSIRVIRIGKEGEEWSEISTEEFMKMIAEAVPILYSELTAKTEHPEEEDKMEEEVSGGGIEVAMESEPVEEHEHEIEGMVGEGNFAQHSTDQGMAKDECGSSAKSRREVIDDVIQRLTKLVGSGKTSRRLLDMEMIYLTDCGGQQAYWDLAPIFMRDTSATLFVHRLCEKLDEHPLNDLYQSGKRVGPEERARLTTSQAFKTMLQGLDKEENRSKIIVVGTHKDLLHECGEKPGDKNDILKTIASPHFDDDVVYCNEGMDDVLFQMNTKTPNDDDKKEAGKIRTSIHKVATYHKIPIWWFILQRILEALAEKLNRKVLTKEECAHVSNILGFTEGELEAALSFLDKLNIFLYKKKILPDLIFTDAQVPLDKLSALVERQYCLKVAEKAPEKAMDVATSGCKEFRDKGILTVEFLKGV